MILFYYGIVFLHLIGTFAIDDRTNTSRSIRIRTRIPSEHQRDRRVQVDPIPYYSTNDVTILGAPNFTAGIGNPLKGLAGGPRYSKTSPLPNKVPLAIEFYNIGLDEIMIGSNLFNWTLHDKFIKESASRMMHVVISVYIHWPGKPLRLPPHLSDIPLYDTDNGLSPNYGEPRLVNAMKQFIVAWGKRIDGDTRVAAIHIGLLGFWGEGHTYPDVTLIPESTKQTIAKWYRRSFTKTQVQARYPGPNADGFGLYDGSLAYSTLDGAANGGKAVSWFMYPQMLKAKQEDTWKQNVMGGETRAELQKIIFTDDYAARTEYRQDYKECIDTLHISYTLHHDAFQKGGYSGYVLRNANAIHEYMGYAFYVSEVTATLSSPSNSGTVDIAVEVSQIGVAPFYYDLNLVLDCEGLMKITLPGVEQIVLKGQSKTFLFRNVPKTKQCLDAVIVYLQSSYAFEGRPIRFAQGADGKVLFSVPVDPTQSVPTLSPVLLPKPVPTSPPVLLPKPAPGQMPRSPSFSPLLPPKSVPVKMQTISPTLPPQIDSSPKLYFKTNDTAILGKPNVTAAIGNPLKGLAGGPRYSSTSPLPSTIPSAIEFYNIGLDEIMIGDNQFDWKLHDQFLSESASRMMHAVLSVYIHWPGRPLRLPPHLLNIPMYDTDKGKSPNYGDPRLLAALKQFIGAWGKRTDGDTRVAAIHVGLLGFWGEGHTYPDITLVPESSKQSVAQWYRDSFNKTQIQARYPGPNADGFGLYDGSLAYATLDGSANGGKKVSWFMYPQIIKAQQGDAWKQHIIGGETRPELQKIIFTDTYPARTENHQEYEECIDTLHLSYALHHDAFQNGGYSGNMLRNANAIHAYMGYAFYVSEIAAYGSTQPDSSTVDISVELTQLGVAPFYYDLSLALDCNGLIKVALPGVDEIILKGQSKTFLFRNVPKTKRCLEEITLFLQSSYAYDGRPIRFAQGIDGKFVLAIPLPQNEISSMQSVSSTSTAPRSSDHDHFTVVAGNTLTP
jgi:hypothetical protein